ncbi:CMP-N-acetylneuraminate-beta-galactosamide-alpha- 2,3-sialyltransferase [Pectobacterium carotovorum subsp. carotovorum]|nr:CMP-N-acetylneuraminate-beta-galactosamide-alpha- 2,3-sialyltransferase [Pectobacterium carotovorum subsp. carotovorum]
MDLYLCFTPLQSLIAKRLMEVSDRDNGCLYISDVDSSIARSYFKSISCDLCFSEFILLTGNKYKDLYKIIRMKKKIKKTVNNVYVASIDNIYFQLFLSRLDFNGIYTFDDGMANIYKAGIYHNSYETKGIRFLGYKILGGYYTTELLKKKSLHHFSIYDKNIKNIVDKNKVSTINLFSSEEIDSATEISQVIKIFAGQPVYYKDPQKSKDMTLKALNVIKPDFYFPHPREDFHIDNVSYIRSDLIIEDYILSFLKSNKNSKIILFSFFSSALANLANVELVDVYAVKTADIENHDIFDLIDELNIPIVNI